MSAVDFDVLKDAVTARLVDLGWGNNSPEVTVSLEGCDPEMHSRLHLLLDRAFMDDYSIEIRLVTYEGAPNAVVARQRRKKKKAACLE